jgi:hypothetical protein
MSRLERKLLAVIDDLDRLAAESEQVDAELSFHRLIHDDTTRDAAVSELDVDRREAGATGADVRRFERRLAEIATRRAKLEAIRRDLTQRLS